MKRKARWCYVGDTLEDVLNKKHKRIFIADVGAKHTVMTVNIGGEEDYIQGYYFSTALWKYGELIKEPEYTPFDATNIEDVKQLLNKVLIHKKDGYLHVVNGDIDSGYMDMLLKEYTFEDGTPVGKLKE